MLLIGLTREVVEEESLPVVSDVSQASQELPQLQGTRTVEELLRKVDQLRAGIASTDQQIEMANQRLTKLDNRIKLLFENTLNGSDE